MDRQRAVSAKNDAEMQADKLQAKMAAMPKVSQRDSTSHAPWLRKRFTHAAALPMTQEVLRYGKQSSANGLNGA